MNTSKTSAPVVQVYSCTLCNVISTAERDEEHALARMCEHCHALAETDEHLTRTHGASIAADAHDIVDAVGKLVANGGIVHPLAQRLFALASALIWAQRARPAAGLVRPPSEACEVMLAAAMDRVAQLESVLISTEFQLRDMHGDLPEECGALSLRIAGEMDHLAAARNSNKAPHGEPTQRELADFAEWRRHNDRNNFEAWLDSVEGKGKAVRS